jgi:hypothetical protein
LRRKFDFYDINILEPRDVAKGSDNVTIPRRLVITFRDNINGQKLNELIEDIKLSANFKKVFNDKFLAKCLRPFKLTGHLDKDSKYIVHKTSANDRKGRLPQKTGAIGTKGGKRNNNPLIGLPQMRGIPGGKPGLIGMKGGKLPFQPGMMPQSGLINPGLKPGGLMMPVGFPMGGNPLGGNPLGGNPLGVNPLGGNPLMGNPLAGNPLAGNPLAGNPLAGNPLAGNPLSKPVNPLAGSQKPVNPLAKKEE